MNSTIDSPIILIVDDNPNNLGVLSDTLASAGFQVAVAIDGESALEQVKYHCPELILLDVMMPGLNGFETCQRFKADPNTCDIPIIFMTALSDSDDKVQGLSLGAVDYITKPFQQEEVLARIKIHLKLRNLTRTLEDQNKLLRQQIEQREIAEAALKTLNEKLEQRVGERTQELADAFQELQRAQAQLVHNDRLFLLGQLVAGIAHEINNPVNFIYGNIKPASEYLQNLLTLVDLYQNPTVASPDRIQTYLDHIDFEFLKRDFPKILNSMKLGAERIRGIVLSLRNFSRLDEAEMKAVDIHEGIESTLLILHGRLKSKNNTIPATKVIKQYANLPPVECYPAQLNQVFMNLLCNAIDTLDERSSKRSPQELAANPNTITITTEVANNNRVVIRIADNGPGIENAVKKHLFKPFFTTKPVGKGTGLGLSISHQIVVEKHGGAMWCQSEPGQGAEFWIELPIKSVSASIPDFINYPAEVA
jgi:signal transduction histidine kinase